MLVLPNMAPPHHSTSSALLRNLSRNITNVATRLSLLLLKIVMVSFAMLFLPRTIQIIVSCLDELQENLGRRAQSPFETPGLWGYGSIIALALLMIYHDVLYRLGYNVILDEGGSPRAGLNVTWERALVRMIIPALIMSYLVLLAWRLGWDMDVGRPLINANTVDLQDDQTAGLVWRDL
jgi:hypothetical protein